MVYSPQPPNQLVRHWLERHRNPLSFILHIIGIPPTILGVLLFSIYVGLFSRPVFMVALVLFLGGYLLQFAGHALEGTDPGEIIYFKRKLGLPMSSFPRKGTPHGIPRRQPESILLSAPVSAGIFQECGDSVCPIALGRRGWAETGLGYRPCGLPRANLI